MLQGSCVAFAIRFVNSTICHPKLAFGEIIIGGFVEQFESILTSWSEADYQRQWADAIRRIYFGQSASCLITTLPFRGYADFFECWPMRRNGDHVVFSQVWIPIEEAFDPAQPYDYFARRTAHSGARVPEWSVHLSELQG